MDRALDGVDRVFHLGGVVGNGESMINARNAVDVNSVGTATLMEAVIARRDAIRRLGGRLVDGRLRRRRLPLPEHGDVDPGPATRRAAARSGVGAASAGLRAGARARADHARTLPLRPTSVYGITKRDQEELALVLGRPTASRPSRCAT